MREEQSEASLDLKNIWQHPYVDVFKHFKIFPTQDWKINKKQGDVTELFVSLKTAYILGQRDRSESNLFKWNYLSQQFCANTTPK
jgi:hypothetical protein